MFILSTLCCYVIKEKKIMNTFEVKKTTELSTEEKHQIITLFNIIFEKERDVKEFDSIYYNNVKGYGYHTLMKADGAVVGHNAGIPCYYKVDGKEASAICNIDTMIHPKHRGIENYYDLMKSTFDKYYAEGYDFIYGFPNDNAFPLITGIKIMKFVGNLDTYCLPFRIGGIKKNFGFLNWASILFCECWVHISSLFASKGVSSFLIEKDEETFNETRYKRMGGNYSKVSLSGLDFVYKVEDYDGIRAAFLIDVTQKSAKNFCRAAKYIWKQEKKNCDIILYVGVLSFNKTGFIKIPRKYEPKKFNFTAILNTKVLGKKDFYDISSWDMNLSNYDLI